jgi:acyl carrier protein
MDELNRTLQGCLRRHLPLAPEDDLDMSEELLLLGLDSMGAIALLLDVEEAFAVEFPREMLDPKTFRTGETLLAAVREMVAARPGTTPA